MTPLGDRLRRAWRRTRGRRHRRRVGWVYSRRYQLAFQGTPIDPLRADRILAFLLTEGLVPRKNLHRPQHATMRDLRLAHTDAYLEALPLPGAMLPIVGYELDEALQEQALDVQRLAAGGTIGATERALRQRPIAVHLGGGFHHARPEAGMGFCIFNDVAVAIAAARERGFRDRVLVIDLDLHDGNGTRAAFARDPTVFTFSIHNRNWDEEEATASLSLALGSGVDDDTYLRAIEEHLPPVLADFRPRLVYYLAGTDPAADDRLGDWKISAAGLVARDRYVVSRVARAGEPPLVVLLAGGYGTATWRHSARFLGWLASGQADLEPPSTAAMTLARYRKLVDTLDPRHLGSETAELDDGLWEISEEDIYGGLGPAARPQRLLGHYSRHGIELLLESAGLLERLRAIGYRRPTLEFDLDNPTGETFRVYGDAARAKLLMETRVRIDRRSLEGYRLMRLEWLLLQDPRRGFDPARQPLPGQRHPGLGLLNDVMALLITLAERLRLDGILFVPSHYHLAAKGQKYLRFVEPADEAWMRALRRAVAGAGVPLADATRAVAAGGVVDAAGRAVSWRPMLMVLPLSGRLRERVQGEEYERRVEREVAAHDFRLAAAGAPL